MLSSADSIASGTNIPTTHVSGKILSVKQVDALLRKPIDSEIGLPQLDTGEQPTLTFETFAEGFVTTADIRPVILMIGDPEVRKLPIQLQWPSGHKPTVREILDLIAKDTGTRWQYATEGDARLGPGFLSDQEFMHDLVIFKFSRQSKPVLRSNDMHRQSIGKYGAGGGYSSNSLHSAKDFLDGKRDSTVGDGPMAKRRR